MYYNYSMSIVCTIFGHKSKRGAIKTFDETLRCVRCNKQLVYPNIDIMTNTLKETSDAKLEVADSLDPIFRKTSERLRKEAKAYKKAANHIEEEENK